MKRLNKIQKIAIALVMAIGVAVPVAMAQGSTGTEAVKRNAAFTGAGMAGTAAG